MDCVTALKSLTLLGALVSSNPERSISIFQDRNSRATFQLMEGDYYHNGLRLIRIVNGRRVFFTCQGLTLPYIFSPPIAEEPIVEPDVELEPVYNFPEEELNSRGDRDADPDRWSD